MDEHETLIYEICIERKLGATTAAMFPEFTLDETNGMTVMRGSLPDQTALHGVLNRIRDLGLTLVSVERISASDKGES